MYIVTVCVFKHLIYTHNQKLLLNIQYVSVFSKNIIRRQHLSDTALCIVGVTNPTSDTYKITNL
jgi:hypothetical protein